MSAPEPQKLRVALNVELVTPPEGHTVGFLLTRPELIALRHLLDDGERFFDRSEVKTLGTVG